MNSITIHGIDEATMTLIREMARSQGLSLNKTIKKLIEVSLGIRPREEFPHTEQFEEFLGLWSESDLDEFERATRDFEQIDEGDWS